MRKPRFDFELVMLGYKVNEKLRGTFEIYFNGTTGFHFEKVNLLGDIMSFDVSLDKIRIHIYNHTDWEFSKTIKLNEIEKFSDRFIRMDLK